jgi:ArsR family transcriptional regulator
MPTATPPRLHRTARWFHALSDKTRLEILTCLRQGEQCVCDLNDTFKTGQSRLSFHLKVLKDAGLIKDRPEGRWVYYSLDPGAIEEMEDFLESLKEVIDKPRRTLRC